MKRLPARRWRRGICLCLLLGLALPSHAQDVADKVKAAFLFNFARFVTWPPEAVGDSDTLELCVLGESGVSLALAQSVDGKRSGDHPLRARQIDSIDEVTGCHALFLPGDTIRRLPADTLAQLAAANVLTVHEDDEAVAGGVIRLFIESRRVRFEVNRGAAERAGLRLSSKLLSVARVVDTG